LYYTATDFYVSNYSFPAALGVWYPVLDGTNGNFNLYGVAGYGAGYYYNDCCGLGSLFGPYAYQWLTDLTQTSSLDPADLKAKPSTSSAEITWSAVSGATGYVIYLDAVIPIGSPPTGYELTGAARTTITKKTSVKFTGLNSKGYYGVFVGAVTDKPSLEAGESDIVFQTK
jgi:hypothetical protein